MPGQGGRGKIVVAAAMSYSTLFPLTESPIVEDGGWVKGGTTGLLWTDPNTTGGLVVNSQDNTGGFDDSIAHRTGTWSPNQKCSSTVFKGTTHDQHEVEHLLRFLITANNARGYEILWAHDGAYGPQLMRWNGPGAPTNFTQLTDFALATALVTGDVIETSIVGTVVTLKLNNVTVGTFDVATGAGADNVWATGSPGIGSYRGGAAAPDQFAWTDWSAVEI
jgi:hypothetical protein